MPSDNSVSSKNGSKGGQLVRLRTDEQPLGQGDDNRENGVCIDKYDQDNEAKEVR